MISFSIALLLSYLASLTAAFDAGEPYLAAVQSVVLANGCRRITACPFSSNGVTSYSNNNNNNNNNSNNNNNNNNNANNGETTVDVTPSVGTNTLVDTHLSTLTEAMAQAGADPLAVQAWIGQMPVVPIVPVPHYMASPYAAMHPYALPYGLHHTHMMPRAYGYPMAHRMMYPPMYSSPMHSYHSKDPYMRMKKPREGYGSYSPHSSRTSMRTRGDHYGGKPVRPQRYGSSPAQSKGHVGAYPPKETGWGMKGYPSAHSPKEQQYKPSPQSAGNRYSRPQSSKGMGTHGRYTTPMYPHFPYIHGVRPFSGQLPRVQVGGGGGTTVSIAEVDDGSDAMVTVPQDVMDRMVIDRTMGEGSNNAMMGMGIPMMNMGVNMGVGMGEMENGRPECSPECTPGKSCSEECAEIPMPFCVIGCQPGKTCPDNCV